MPPAESEAQRGYMMGWMHNPEKMKGKKPKMSKKQMGEYTHMKSSGHMPVDETWGDVGAKRQDEAVKVGGFADGPTVYCEMGEY